MTPLCYPLFRSITIHEALTFQLSESRKEVSSLVQFYSSVESYSQKWNCWLYSLFSPPWCGLWILERLCICHQRTPPEKQLLRIRDSYREALLLYITWYSHLSLKFADMECIMYFRSASETIPWVIIYPLVLQSKSCKRSALYSIYVVCVLPI